MTEDDLRIECLRLQIPASGLDKSAIQRQLLGHIVARATSTPASQATAPPVYAAGKTDQLGPELQGLDLEDLNLEESDHGEQVSKTLRDRTKTYRKPCTTHLAREIPFGILGVYRMLRLPTRVPESFGSGRIDPARQRPTHLPRVGPCHSFQMSLMSSCSSDA